MSYYDNMMKQYYKVLINNWKTETAQSAKIAIKMLSNLPKSEKFSDKHVKQMSEIINTQLGEDFAARVNSATQKFSERCLRLGFGDAKVQAGMSISWGFAEQSLSAIIQKQNVFWVGNHFNADVSEKFKDTLHTAIKEGYTKAQLSNLLKTQFKDIINKGGHYFNGLAQHTALRVREFGRLSGYEKAGAVGYRLMVIVDDRTSDICMALHNENKIYPLDEAIDTRDQLMSIDMKPNNLDKARDQIKAIAPWVNDNNVIYNNAEKPIGVRGAYTPFPPFHWKCRTTTEIVM